jgi:hypothetical protein
MVRTLSIFEIPQKFTQLVIRMIVSLTIPQMITSIIAVVDGDDRLSNSKAVNRISYVYDTENKMVSLVTT